MATKEAQAFHDAAVLALSTFAGAALVGKDPKCTALAQRVATKVIVDLRELGMTDGEMSQAIFTSASVPSGAVIVDETGAAVDVVQPDTVVQTDPAITPVTEPPTNG